MAQDWNYAQLSKAAKVVGGPEKLADKLIQAGRQKGKTEMVPWFGVAAVGGSLLTVGVIKAVDFFKSKNEQNQAEIEEEAKKELISGIKEYDAMHLDEGGGEKMTRKELKEQIDELMRQYADEEIDADTYAQSMMALTTSVQAEFDED